ncbi:MAG: NosD domain-containing protein [Planctomycetota bacterium]
MYSTRLTLVMITVAAAILVSPASAENIDPCDDGTVSGCSVSRNAGGGIVVASYCRVTDNHCHKNIHTSHKAGIHVIGSHNHIEGNTVTQNNYGIKVDQDNNLIISNRARNNIGGGDYSIVGGNAYGQIIDVAGGGSFSNNDPTANFTF